MTKHKISLKQVLVTATLAILVVCILTSLTPTMFAQAQSQTVTVVPAEGPARTRVVVNCFGFRVGSLITVSFNGDEVATVSGTVSGQSSVAFNIPKVADGSYEILATSSNGGSATTTFTVSGTGSTSSGGSSNNTPEPTSTSTSGTSHTTGTTTAAPHRTVRPTTTPQNSGLSPYVIGGVVVVAIVIIIPVLFMLRSRSGSRRDLLERERERETFREPAPIRSVRYTPPSRPGSTYGSSTSRYNPPPTYGRYSTRPASSPSRYGQSTYGQSRSSYTSSTQRPTSTKTCPNCRKTIRADYRSCPYCNKKV
jgi:hypothetical protein